MCPGLAVVPGSVVVVSVTIGPLSSLRLDAAPDSKPFHSVKPLFISESSPGSPRVDKSLPVVKS